MHCKHSLLYTLTILCAAGWFSSPLLADKEYPDMPWWVDISTLTTNQERGLSEVTGLADGITEGATIGTGDFQRDCRRLVDSTGSEKCLYLDVDDLYYHGDGPGVMVVVTYFSTGNGTFRLDYDASDNAYSSTSSRNIGNSQDWQKARFWLPNPKFAGRQNGGADLRIVTSQGDELYIEYIAVAKPAGPFVAGVVEDSTSPTSFSSTNDRLLCTSYFYWYSINSHVPHHLIDWSDETDALTDHPASIPGVSDIEYVDESGPVVPADFGWQNTTFHRRELLDIMDAKIDIVLPVYWGGTDEFRWTVFGVERLVKAAEQLIAEGKNPPKIGMFFDTSTLAGADRLFGTNTATDLSTEDGRNYFIKQVIDFWSLVPPKLRACIDGQPVMFLYDSAFARNWNQQLFTELDARFAENFGGTTPYVVREDSWTGVATDSVYNWGASLNGVSTLDTGAVGPGFDNSAVPWGGLVRDRNGGQTYIDDWNTMINNHSGFLVHVETWSEWHEASEVANSAEYGKQYIELTQEYGSKYKGFWGGTNNAIILGNTIPQTQYAGRAVEVTVTVKNTGQATWTREGLYKLGAVEDSDPFFTGNRIELPEGVSVSPGEEYTFHFLMTAPTSESSETTDWQMVQDGTGWFGEIHSEPVKVLNTIPTCKPENDPKLLENPEFLGGRGSATDTVSGQVPDGWRAVALGSGTADVDIVPLPENELYPGSPATNALRFGIGSGSSGAVTGDAAIDKDDDSTRIAIPAERRIYSLFVDARDGGPNGGTDLLNLGLQFGNDATGRLNRGCGYNPQNVFETFGVSGYSNESGLLSCRLDVGNAIASAELDNIRIYDVTEHNRMINGGFENSDNRAVSWRYFETAGESGSVSISSDAYEGNNACLLDRWNADGDTGLDIDLPGYHIASTGDETLFFQFAAKKVSGSNCHLKLVVAGYDENDTWVGGSIFDGFFEPGTEEYTVFTVSGTTTSDTRFINIGFRVINGATGGGQIGSYLIDDVQVTRVLPPVDGNIMTGGDFEEVISGWWSGSDGWGDSADLITFPHWRFFAVGGRGAWAVGNENAASEGNMGLELQWISGGGDSALDKDDPSIREIIPAEERIYKFSVDVKDGGDFGGTDYFNLQTQFPNGINRSTAINPGANWETLSLTAKSGTSGYLSARFDLGAPMSNSCFLDNVTCYDVTCDENRIPNGGFENSDSQTLGWRYFAVGGADGSVTISNDAASGNNAALMTRTVAGGDLGFDLWGEPLDIPVIPGETIHVDLMAKKVMQEDSRLIVAVHAFDSDNNYLATLYESMFNPGDTAYEAITTEGILIPADTYYVSVGFRIRDPENTDNATGSYLIDDISLMADCNESGNGPMSNLVPNGSFESDPVGTTVSGTDVGEIVNTIDQWRVFAVGGACIDATIQDSVATDGNQSLVFSRNPGSAGDRILDTAEHWFEIRDGLQYEAEFYIKSARDDSSDQDFNFSWPLFTGDTYIEREPGSVSGTATSSWQLVQSPVFHDSDATNGHIAFRVTPDANDEGAILIAMPSITGSRLPNDANGDGVVDLDDFNAFVECVAGPGALGTRLDCACLDQDADGDVDLADFAIYQTLFENN